jgi:hypothetical protein
MVHVANCGPKITLPISFILRALVYAAGVMGSLDPSPVTAQTQEQNGIMTCSIEAFYIAPKRDEERREVIATVQQPTVPKDFAHGFESEIDTIVGHPEAGLSGANILCKTGVDNAFTIARAQSEERSTPQARDTWVKLRVDIRHNPLSMGNRGVADSRYTGPKIDKSYLDESYHSDLPKETDTSLKGFRVLFNREY